MLAGYEFECPVCKFYPENGNDLEDHMMIVHNWSVRTARDLAKKQRQEARSFINNEPAHSDPQFDNLRAYRKKKFAVEIRRVMTDPIFEDEAELLFTHNGSQWRGIALTKEEAQKVIDVLKEHFKFFSSLRGEENKEGI